MVRTRLPVLAAGTLLALSVVAPNGHAQAVTREAAPRLDAAAPADDFHNRAISVLETAGAHRNGVQQFRKAARLHLQSATRRSADDPQASGCVREAAKLLHRIDPAQATLLMEQAGGTARDQGDVLTAAHAFLDAAEIVASQRRLDAAQFDHAESLVVRARRLAISPLLTKDERASILARLQPAGKQLRIAAQPQR